ncbi:MAG TPA: HEAT repeat domain-containing protein [Candidatus Limnocylindria bacterium]|jgi:HEAT repeat protein|nr:HEAT repeat domain-containing protein [Candidatus Limnocylindria bacterium]
MNCEQASELAADRLTGNLSAEAGEALVLHYETCPACRAEAEAGALLWQQLAQLPEPRPSADLDERFQSMLRGYREGLRAAETKPTLAQMLKAWRAPWWRRQLLPQLGFAVVLLSTGLFLGRFWFHGTSMSPAPTETAGAGPERSSSERLRDLEASVQAKLPEDRMVASLLHALDFDPSVNVRLAALDALQTYADQARVRQALLDSLTREESPLVQVGLIDLIVEQQEKSAVPVLKALLEKAELNRSVRKRAAWGLTQLG